MSMLYVNKTQCFLHVIIFTWNFIKVGTTGKFVSYNGTWSAHLPQTQIDLLAIDTAKDPVRGPDPDHI